MKVRRIDPPRTFTVGKDHAIHIKHCADIELEPDEQVTFRMPSGIEYDVVHKSWGYYATPSLNGRLRNHGLRAVLVMNASGKAYILLVKKGNESEFQAYLDAEQQAIICWLDSDEAVRNVSERLKPLPSSPCPICGGTEMSLVFHYDAPPTGETRFDFTDLSYKREIWQCQTCGHFVSHLAIDLDALYESEYVEVTYGAEGLLPTFRRIMALPPEQSDNYQRVKRIIAYQSLLPRTRGIQQRKPSVLDVGSGLCVFLARLKEEGWVCTAIDPDAHAVEHAKQHVGVKAICNDFMRVSDIGHYDLIAFNKVLEHVPDPFAMLKKSREHLAHGGTVYVEVPDGELAMKEGPEREEFFIEHRHVFSIASLSVLATRAGFITPIIGRVRDPSDKYTLYAFLTDARANQ